MVPLFALGGERGVVLSEGVLHEEVAGCLR